MKKTLIMKTIFVFFFNFLFYSFLFSQDITNEWHHLDPKKDKILGISTEKAYQILKDKTPVPVIVAVIDGGIDIKHEDIVNSIWINEKEIPENNIDDDNNGYIDDIYGWNFLGNPKGENIHYESLEMTRIISKNISKIKGMEKGEYKPANEKEKEYLEKVLKRYKSKYDKAAFTASSLVKYYANYLVADSIIKSHIKKDSYTIEEIYNINADSNSILSEAVNFILLFKIMGMTEVELSNLIENERKELDYHLNINYNPRAEIIGDDPENNDNRFYGNPDVIGPDPEHGTLCAGIIAANRNNNIGTNGIAPFVKIMTLRAIPDGDERDKDVANAIRYAVDNGAKIINMSFGKEFSPQKHFVDEVLEYIKNKDVLLVHSAGNEGYNNDSTEHYPTNINENGDVIFKNWITVGASDMYMNKYFVAPFSNYGKKTVDIFAPGVNIYSTTPNNSYGPASGTSFSSPIVSGIAALLLSYYPELTCAEVKDIILNSGTYLGRKKVSKPSKELEETEEYESTKKEEYTKFKNLCRTGRIVNAYNAVKLAEKLSKKKKR